MNPGKLIGLVAVLAGLSGFPASALADNAYTTGALNVRTGPSAGYPKIATLPAGLSVTVTSCQGSWCRIREGGIRGWVSSNYLNRAYSNRPTVVLRPTIVVRPPYGHRPPRRPHRPRPDRCKIAPGFPCR